MLVSRRQLHSARNVYLALILVAIALPAALLLLISLTSRMSQGLEPHVNATHHIIIEATAAFHSGTNTQYVEKTLRHLTMADWYADALLLGGSNNCDSIPPSSDPEVRQSVRVIKGVLSKVRKAIEKHPPPYSGFWDIRPKKSSGGRSSVLWEKRQGPRHMMHSLPS